MKKLIALIIALVAACTLTAVFAEEADPFFAQFEGMNWTFCSGVGAWSTDLQIRQDGTFSGEYHDSDMGDAAEAYPDGTVYYCSFTGRMSLIGPIDDNTWLIIVNEVTTGEPEQEMIIDGIRFVNTKPYGITEGDAMQIYRPGTTVAGFTDSMKLWAHLYDYGEPVDTLPTWFMYSYQTDCGFTGEP